MNLEASSIPAEIWAEYEVLQSKIRRVKKIDSYAWALEDELNCVLASEGLPANSEARTKVLRNLLLNRIKKHSRRYRLLEEHYRVCVAASSAEEMAIHFLEFKEITSAVQVATSRAEWRILTNLAEGESYDAVAKREGMSISALKSKVCRCRRHLKAIAA
jgi:hypothetical protein